MVLLMVALLSFFLCHSSELDTYEVQFQQFVKEHHKNYVPGTTEYNQRLDIFQKTLKRIERLNTLRTHEESAVYGVTKFADLTPGEFEDRVIRRLRRLENEIKSGLGLRRHKRDIYANDIVSKLPPKFPVRIDWRDKKVISPVRNQGKCGACWAYSTIETIEAMVAIKTKKPLVELSVQQIIDCAAEDNHGCDGGDTCGALSWMSDYNVKIQTAKDYPMREDAGDCRAISPKTGVQIYSNFTCNNYTGDEIEMVKLLAEHGPLVAAVDAASWQDYLGGIIQYHCETKRNHAVQIVGYDISGEIPYYIVRNTWGTEFGLDGYLRIAIGKNLCGIAEEISAVDVKEPEGESPAAWEIMWNDPMNSSEFNDLAEFMKVRKDKVHGFLSNSKRGTAFYYSDEAVDNFLKVNNLQYILRGHEVMPLGYKFHMNGKVMTIFSSSRYCGGTNEAASVFVDNEEMRVVRFETHGELVE